MSDSKDLDIYRGGGGVLSEEQAAHLRELEFHARRQDYQERYWLKRGKFQTDLMEVAVKHEESKQRLIARREHGPRLLKVQYEYEISEIEIKLAENRAAIADIEGQSRKRNADQDMHLQGLYALRAQYLAKGMVDHVKAIDAEIARLK